MSQTYPILINLFAAIIGACGQYLYKVGAARLKDVPIYQNWQVILGMILFTLVMVLFIIAFRMGGRMSVVYPMYATTFLWGSLMGILIDKEPWNPIQLIGVVLVMVGISVVAYFSPVTK